MYENIKEYMNWESINTKVPEDICSVSGCKEKYIKIVQAGNVGVALCKEHLKQWNKKK